MQATDPLTIGAMRANHDALCSAISQDSFTMTITVDGTVWQYPAPPDADQ